MALSGLAGLLFVLPANSTTVQAHLGGKIFIKLRGRAWEYSCDVLAQQAIWSRVPRQALS